MKNFNKMVAKKYFLLLFVCMIFQSSDNRRISNYSLDDVPIIIDVNTMRKSPLTVNPLKMKNLRYVTLETTDECLIGNADKVLISNNRIYVADFHKTMTLFIFDLNGKFISKIAKRGQGPGEYISFNDFDIYHNENVYIFDSHGRKILTYNSAGEYLKEIKLKYYLLNFCIIDEKMYWSPIYNNGIIFANLAVYDVGTGKTNLLFTEKKFLYDMDLMHFSSYKFYKSSNTTYYTPKFSEIIYSITNNGISPAIGIKNLQKPPEYVIEKWSKEQDDAEKYKSIMSGPYFYENLHIYETDNYISIRCIMGANYTLLYNKQTKETDAVRAWDIFDTIGVSEIRGCTEKEFFSVINYFNPENIHHKKILETRPELADYKEDDNPVLVFFGLDM